MKSLKNRRPLAERLQKSLLEGIQYFRGELELRTTVFLELPPPVNAAEVAELRAQSQMSQAEFARLLNVPLKTVQSWEQGIRKPSQAALRLIQVLRQSPQGVFEAAGVLLPRSPQHGTKRRAAASTAQGRAKAEVRNRKQSS